MDDSQVILSQAQELAASKEEVVYLKATVENLLKAAKNQQDQILKLEKELKLWRERTAHFRKLVGSRTLRTLKIYHRYLDKFLLVTRRLRKQVLKKLGYPQTPPPITTTSLQDLM